MSEPNPTQVYLDIQNKVENGHDYGAAETRADFQRLFHALRATLAENSHLKATVDSAEALLAEQDIEIFNKDIELYNMTTQFEKMKEK